MFDITIVPSSLPGQGEGLKRTGVGGQPIPEEQTHGVKCPEETGLFNWPTLCTGRPDTGVRHLLWCPQSVLRTGTELRLHFFGTFW